MDAKPSHDRFIADAMLGKLSKWLRILGVDVAYETKIEDEDLIEQARAESRIVLTRDTQLIKRKGSPPVRFILIRDDCLPDQLRQIVDELDLSTERPLFTRCIECNLPLENASRDKAAQRVPAYVFKSQTRFSQCPECHRIYWAGTHLDHVQDRLHRILPPKKGQPGA